LQAITSERENTSRRVVVDKYEMLETQIFQLVPTSSQALGKYPSKTETNLVEHANVVTLRSDRK
ncbi:hypothetical protein CR513_59817, partial [Mucuna pruriens]